MERENVCFVHAIKVKGDQYGFVFFMNKNSLSIIQDTLFCVPQKKENHVSLKKNIFVLIYPFNIVNYEIIFSEHRQAE